MANAVKKEKAITQFSTVNALFSGLYDGQFSVQDVVETGEFGLGCSHGIDGEVIVQGGECYVAKAGKPLAKMQHHDMLPFAQVATFHEQRTLALDNIDKEQLTHKLLALADTQNLFIGLKLKGAFKTVKVRRPPVVQKPYPPMMEALAKQEEEAIDQPSGTLIGFWAPKEYQGLTVAGLHVHFINDAQNGGGHVLDFELVEGQLSFELYDGFNLRLPTTTEFLQADLAYNNLDADIEKAEG